jgi:hypothetical protein
MSGTSRSTPADCYHRGVLRLLAVVACAGGCDVLFKLESVEIPDARACGTLDEDTDAVPDSCDVCPGLPDPDQADDGDHDGVGNACDPNQSVIHRRLRFDGFADAATDALRWPSVGSSVWMFGSGAVGHASTDGVGELQYVDVDDASPLIVEVGFTFESWSDPTTNAPTLGARIDAAQGQVTGHDCHVTPYSATTTEDTVLLVEDGGAARPVAIAALSAGDRVVVMLERTRTPDAIRCRVLVNEVERVNTTKTAEGAWPAAGRIGVRATYASASLRYVAVYATP